MTTSTESATGLGLDSGASDAAGARFAAAAGAGPAESGAAIRTPATMAMPAARSTTSKAMFFRVMSASD